MHTAGTGAERTAIFILISMLRVIIALCGVGLKKISASCCFCTGQAGKSEHINTEYEYDDLHYAKVTDSIKNSGLQNKILSQLCCNMLLSMYLIYLLIHLLQYGQVLFQPV